MVVFRNVASFPPLSLQWGAKPADPMANLVFYVLIFFLLIFFFVFMCLKDPLLDLTSEGGAKSRTFSSV